MSWQLRDWIRLLVLEGVAVIILVFVFWWFSRRRPTSPPRDEQCVPPPSKPVPVPAVLPASVPPEPPPPVPPVSEAVTPAETVAPAEYEVTSTEAPEEAPAAAVTYAGWGATAAAMPAEEVAAPVPAEAVAAATPAGLPAEEVAAPVRAEAVAAAAPAMPPQPDDLTIMEGIGPKIASVLAAAGVTTFAQLAAADVDWLREVMLAAGLRLADPTTWPEQSRLAAAGDWEGLKELQGQLKGGRRVK